ncbi:hypothetical protein LXM25_10040 [Dyadobacter sp. LJ53]|uniref:hypothetical protein n=1 Tax=Dyadobacter chenwenxiniae TaxID=2906456 RepID=UPI001F159ED7|nr:hypothetical protein [Dyadobacter chenwenxiniae]MCF0050398.1 hypothetical protein [Dyadobacter chenwenxiniae]
MFPITLQLTLILLTSCSNNDNLNVRVKDSDTQYTFTAQYDRGKTIAVQQYVNAMLKPNRIFADHDEQVEKDIKLTDGAAFYLESSPGDLTIEFEKQKNSKAAYSKIRKLCLGIKEVVAGK